MEKFTICNICGDHEAITILGKQPACQECCDFYTEQAKAEAAQKAADETAELAYHEFHNQIKAVIIAAGFVIDEHRIAGTGTHYYYISKDFPDGWLEKSIRVADHSDAYGTSDININTPGGQNLDGIAIEQLAERLQEF